ncbi:hypothetical protein, partial [Caldivirga sp. UBA161]|uniref:hypothetical protein n=1 Tax=Caldivirga sp. UBA161 TaxID=1915569 RepID=UPI0025BF3C24
KQIDERFKDMENRFKQIDEKFKSIDERFSEINNRIKQMDDKFNDIKRYIDVKINRLTEAITDYQEFFIEYLSAEGLLKPERASMLRNEAKRIMKLGTSTNPLSKDEWRRLGELLDKDDLTYDEAIELRDLARKIIKEYGEYPEAWKLHIYASIMVGRALRKMSEEGGKK